MNFARFFVDRPIFAGVVSIFITLIGGIAYFALPVAQYPEIAPPNVVVTAQYPGASAEVISNTVSTPLEQEINGVDDMLYMLSQATSDGKLTITVTFKLGTDPDEAQVLVQNRVSAAEPRLPEEVRRLGVTTRKNSPDFLMVVHVFSPDDTRDQLYISNYATLQLVDVLKRIDGVGDVQVFGAREYAMRVWLDPDKIAARNLTGPEVADAVRSQNLQVASGVLNQPPVPNPGAFQMNLETLGRLVEPRQFQNIVVKTGENGEVTSPARRWHRGAGCAGLRAQRIPGRERRCRDRRLPAAWWKRARDRRCRPQDFGRHERSVPARTDLRGGLQSDGVHFEIDRRGHHDHFRSDRARGLCRHHLPADLARIDHSDHRHSGVVGRQLCCHGGAGLFDQHPHAVRVGARHRHRRRRRDRRGRECGAQSAAWHVAERGRAPNGR